MILTLLFLRLLAIISERRANAAVELAIAAPLLLTLATGALSMAVHLDGYLEAQHLANAAARMQASGVDLANARVQALLLTGAESGYLVDVKTYAPGSTGAEVLKAVRFGDTAGFHDDPHDAHAQESPPLPISKADPTTVAQVYYNPSAAGFPAVLTLGVLRATAAY